MKKIVSTVLAATVAAGVQAGIIGDLLNEASSVFEESKDRTKITWESFDWPDYSVSFPSDWRAEECGDDIVRFYLLNDKQLNWRDLRVTIRKINTNAEIDTYVNGFKNEMRKSKAAVKTIVDADFIYSSDTGDATTGRQTAVTFLDGRDQYIVYAAVLKCEGGYQLMSYCAKKEYFAAYSETAKRIINKVVYRGGYLIDCKPMRIDDRKKDEQKADGGNGTRSKRQAEAAFNTY